MKAPLSQPAPNARSGAVSSADAENGAVPDDGRAEKAGRRPRIGITSYQQPAHWGVWDEDAALLSTTYLDCVAAAGGTPLLLPPTGSDPSIVDDLDGLIIAGGSDVGPERYGAARHPLTQPQPHRDDHDLALARAALGAGLPLFAICRGLQVVNTLCGGTLIQHLPDVVDSTAYQPAPGVFGRLEVDTVPGSLAAEILGERAPVSVYHHQAVDRVGEGLVVTARTAEGVVQALELAPEAAVIADAAGPIPSAPDTGAVGRGGSADVSPSAAGPVPDAVTGIPAGERPHGWMLAVQWHPERDIDDLRLFRAFVEASGARRPVGTSRAEASRADPDRSQPGRAGERSTAS